MRILTWVGGLLVVGSLLGILFGLAAYSFAGFPFGGEVAESQTQGIAIMGSSAILLVTGLVLLWARRL